MERRRHERFALNARARCQRDGTWHIVTIRNLSLGGMLVNGLDTVAKNEKLDFTLELDVGSPSVKGVVRAVGIEGASIEFIGSIDPVRLAIRELIQVLLVPELENKLSSGGDDSDTVVQLASFYRDLGRASSGLDLFRTAIELAPRNAQFYVQMAQYFLTCAKDSRADLPGLMEEVTSVLQRLERNTPDTAVRDLAGQIDRLRAELGEPPAEKNKEINELQASIDVERRRLYEEFQRLIEKRNHLQALKQAGEQSGKETFTDRDAVVLEALRRQLEGLRQKAANVEVEEAPAPQKRSARRAILLAGAALALVAAFAGVTLRRSKRPVAPPVAQAAPTNAPAVAAQPIPVVTSPPPATPEPVIEPTPDESRRHNKRITKAAIPEPPPPPQLESAAELHHRQGTEMLKQRKLLLAIKEFEASLGADPGFAPAYQGLGLADLMMGRDRDAVIALEKFVSLAPNHPGAARARELIASKKR